MDLEELLAHRDRLIAAAEDKNRRIRDLEQQLHGVKKTVRDLHEQLTVFRRSPDQVGALARNGQLYSFISKALAHLVLDEAPEARELLTSALRLTPDQLDDLAAKARAREEARRQRAEQTQNRILGPGSSVLRKRIKASTRKKVFDRDGNRCRSCGHAGDERNPLTIDHIIPIAHGGTNEERNLQTLCQACNARKNQQQSGPTPPIDLEKYEIRLVPRRGGGRKSTRRRLT